MHRVERLSIREISKRTGLHRKTIRRALAAETPPRYSRPPAVSKLDPFREWICEQLRADPAIQSLRLREMATELGYEGGKTIFDDYVREVRPRFLVKRTFQRTIYRPGELVQCDLWEPREPIAGRARADAPRLGGDRGAVLVAGDRRRADLLQGGAGHPVGSGSLPVRGSARCRRSWSGTARARSPAAAARPTRSPAFCGQLGVGWVILDAGDAQAKGLLERSHRFMRTNFEPGRRFANPLDFQLQLDGWCDRVNAAGASHGPRRPGRAADRGARADAAAARSGCPTATGGWWCGFRSSRSCASIATTTRSIPRSPGRRVEVRVSQTRGHRGRARTPASSPAGTAARSPAA